MKRIILATGLAALAAMGTSCSNTDELLTPSRHTQPPPGISATLITTVHDYTNVTLDSGHFLLPEGKVGAPVVSSAGVVNTGRGGAPGCPYDDTYEMGLFKPTPQGHAEAFDRLWFQIVAFGSEVVFDLGHYYRQVYISLNQDHGPYPEEALEYRVWVANSPVGPFAMLPLNTPIRVYQGGWSTAGEYDGDCNSNGVLNDDYSAVWSFPNYQIFRYVKLTPIADTGGYNEPEIDAVMGAWDFRVAFDVHPMSCPNPFNPASKGVMPAAILGTSDLDVTSIDPASLTINGVSPVRWNFEDVATPSNIHALCDCNPAGPDGQMDLVLKFDTQALAATLGAVNPGDSIRLVILGRLKDGSPFRGRDCIVIPGGSKKVDTTID